MKNKPTIIGSLIGYEPSKKELVQEFLSFGLFLFFGCFLMAVVSFGIFNVIVFLGGK